MTRFITLFPLHGYVRRERCFLFSGMAEAGHAVDAGIPEQRTTAIQAGWICFALGALTFWVFGIGMVFFSVALVLGVVAMVTHQVRRGLILFSCSFAAIVVIPISCLMLGLGVFGFAVAKARQRSGPSVRSLPVALSSSPSVQGSYAAPRPPRPVRDNSTPAVETFVRQAQLSAIMLGEPAIAVINRKDYEVGQEIIVPSGPRLRITAINSDSVRLHWQDRDFILALQKIEPNRVNHQAMRR